MDKSVDEILLEIGLSSSKKSESNTLTDIDALLTNIAGEERYLEQAAPEPPSESPTKVFRRTTPKRTKEFSAQQTLGQTTPFSKLSPLKSLGSELRGASQPPKAPSQPPKATPAPPPVKPGTGGKQAGGDSTKFSIDVEGIRASSPPPRMIPAIPIESEPAPEPAFLSHEHHGESFVADKEFHFNEKKEADSLDDFLRFAPGYQAAEPFNDSVRISDWEDVLQNFRKTCALRGIVLLLLGLFTLALDVMFQLNRTKMPDLYPSRVLLGIFAGAGLAGLVLGFDIIKSGIFSLFKLQPNRDTTSAVAMLVTFGQAVVHLFFPLSLLHLQNHCYLPLGLIGLSFACFSRRLTIDNALTNLKFLHADSARFVPLVINDSRLSAELTKGAVEDFAIPAVNRQVDTVSDFLKVSLSSDTTDRNGRALAVAGLALGLLGALFIFLFTKQRQLALTVFTAIILVFSPLTNLYLINYPLARSAKLMGKVGGFISGEQCAKQYGDVNAVVIEAKSLFPPSFVSLTGIKTFEGMRVDEAILDAATVLCAAGSVLSDIFLKIIGDRRELLHKIDGLSYEDGKGLVAWLDNRRVLIGNRALMEEHSVRVPSMDYERRFMAEGNDLVYLSTAGELSAVFIITLQTSIHVEDALQMLEDNNIAISVKTIDSILTKERLGRLFEIDPLMVKIIPHRLHEAFTEVTRPVKIKQAVAVDNGTLTSMACAVASGKRMRVMINIGLVIQTVGIILGVAIMLVLNLLGGMGQFNIIVMAAYMLLWVGLDWLIQKLIHV